MMITLKELFRQSLRVIGIDCFRTKAPPITINIKDELSPALESIGSNKIYKDEFVRVRRDRLSHNVHDCYHCPIAPCLPLQDIGYSELTRRLSEGECLQKQIAYLTGSEGEPSKS